MYLAGGYKLRSPGSLVIRNYQLHHSLVRMYTPPEGVLRQSIHIDSVSYSQGSSATRTDYLCGTKYCTENTDNTLSLLADSPWWITTTTVLPYQALDSVHISAYRTWCAATRRDGCTIDTRKGRGWWSRSWSDTTGVNRCTVPVTHFYFNKTI